MGIMKMTFFSNSCVRDLDSEDWDSRAEHYVEQLHKMPAVSSSWTRFNSSSLVPVEAIRAPEIDAGFRATLGYFLQFRDICMKRWTIPNHPAGPSNTRSPYHSPGSACCPPFRYLRMSQTGVGNAPANHFGNSSVSGISSRTSPLGCSPGMNKSVAFSKPPSTIIPGRSPVSSSLTRMGSNLSHPPVGQHQSTLRVGPRLWAEGLMVPPASDAATLRRQVAALQIDFEAHIDGEQRLQSMNQQLRGRSSSFFQICSPLQQVLLKKRRRNSRVFSKEGSWSSKLRGPLSKIRSMKICGKRRKLSSGESQPASGSGIYPLWTSGAVMVEEGSDGDNGVSIASKRIRNGDRCD